MAVIKQTKGYITGVKVKFKVSASEDTLVSMLNECGFTSNALGYYTGILLDSTLRRFWIDNPNGIQCIQIEMDQIDNIYL